MCSERVALRIGARQSDLSKIQAYEVGDALQRSYPKLKIDYYFKPAVGDLDQRTSLAAFEGKGVFTQDLTTLLLNREVDIVVHSFKDLPTEPNPETKIAGTLKRADMRDLLLIRKDRVSKDQKIEKFVILSSSPRRSRNISLLIPKLLPFKVGEVVFKEVRGNVPTRLSKLLSGDASALVVAKAAIDRILKSQRAEFQESREITLKALKASYPMVLPLRENPTAPAQGALAIEIRKGDAALESLVIPMSIAHDLESVREEREVLSSHGGGCHQKIGVSVLNRKYGKILFVQGESLEGKDLSNASLIGSSGKIPTATLDAVWPETKDEGRRLFKRESVSAKEPQKGEALWISRDAALPPEWNPSWDTPLWCAGTETWAKLALRGVLVNGSAEGLGEDEDPNVDIIFGREINWSKLSHTSGEKTSGKDFIATYKLIPSGEIPDLTSKTHFFWMSSSQFLYLLEKFPSIRDGFHSSGPGITASVIARTIRDTKRTFVYLSYEDWRKEVIK